MEFNYKIKQKKEDFVVDEISLQPDFCHYKKSDFSYLWIEKRGMTTFDAIDKIKKVFNLNYEDISAQGLKDEDGVTSQLISIHKIIFQKDSKLFNKKFTSNDYKLQIKKHCRLWHKIFNS
ncbi:MAG: tRNA pseudouridine(13) synthase TruD [Patescibacteria group bacterium]